MWQRQRLCSSSGTPNSLRHLAHLLEEVAAVADLAAAITLAVAVAAAVAVVVANHRPSEQRHLNVDQSPLLPQPPLNLQSLLHPYPTQLPTEHKPTHPATGSPSSRTTTTFLLTRMMTQASTSTTATTSTRRETQYLPLVTPIKLILHLQFIILLLLDLYCLLEDLHFTTNIHRNPTENSPIADAVAPYHRLGKPPMTFPSPTIPPPHPLSPLHLPLEILPNHNSQPQQTRYSLSCVTKTIAVQTLVRQTSC